MLSTSPLEPANLHNDDAGPLVVIASQGLEGHSFVEPHSHPRGQLIGVWRGLLTLGTTAGKWLVPNMHGVWIPPGQLHWANTRGKVRSWSIYVRPASTEGLPREPATLRLSALLREAVRRLEL
ncbi:AraC family ligand binding domain-containing protein, partial [Cupriavidus necator]